MAAPYNIMAQPIKQSPIKVLITILSFQVWAIKPHLQVSSPVQGNLIKSGASIFFHNGGTVLLNGPAGQSFAGLTYNNLILSNNTKTTSGNTTIIDSIKINTGAILSIGPSR